MSHTRQPDAPSPRQVRNLVKGSAAAMAGKKRGTDPAVRRNSYDVDDDRAKPWAPIGDGSAAQGLAHRDALLKAAAELRHQEWKEVPARAERQAREQRASLAAELRQLDASGTAPVGRPATLRQEIARLDALLDRARNRLRRIDVGILDALIRKIDFATGALFPSLETIAAEAGCCRNAVIGALRRLKHHGFVDWVRRSIRTGNAGEFAPQREQTSNAYYFDHRRRMAPRTWRRFWQLLVAKLRRFGATPPGLRAYPPGPVPSDPGLRAALDRLGVSIANAST